jgi:peptidyl-prolyl cis-trans isomerase C
VSSILRALAREPVVHFVIIGAVLFGLDAAVSRGEATDPQGARRAFAVPSEPIVVDEATRATLVEHWNRTHPAPPSEAELRALVQAWIDDEVLYREGLTRGFAENDPRIRERVVSQMAYVLESRLTITEPTDAELKAWFHEHPERYTRPERVDFTQVFVEGRDDAGEAEARELLRLLESGADPNGLGDAFAGGRRFRGRRLSDLADRFGEEFVEGMQSQAPATWVIRRSPFGLHLVRIDRWAAGEAPSFGMALDEVRHDWVRAQRASALDRAKQDLRSQWEIVERP